MALQPHNSQKPKLLDRVRQAIRLRGYAYSTEKTYIHWIKRFCQITPANGTPAICVKTAV